MIRYMLTALCAAMAAVCVPSAAAQTVSGCKSVPTNRVATSKDVAKLTADADCFDVAKTNAEAGAAVRRARIAALTAASKPPTQPVAAIPARIPSNFDTSVFLKKAWGTGEIPASGAPDIVGAFRFHCGPGKIAWVDPIVYPGIKSPHPHQFFGNDAVDENSTYESLRTTGGSTCGKVNRSSYWLPAMNDGRGNYVIPDFAGIYYKRFPKTSPWCQKLGTECVDTPRGLRFVFGHNMLDHTDAPTGAAWFNCDGPGAIGGHYKDIVEAAPNCPVGSRLGYIINSPECWDGKNLDSPDHRGHIAYATWETGSPRCPSTHPKVIPTFTLGVWYTVDANLDRSGKWTPETKTYHFASDNMPGMGMMRPGSTGHADWFGAWDDDVMDAWHHNCLDKLLNCSGGDLGDGRQMVGAVLTQDRANPRLVPITTK